MKCEGLNIKCGPSVGSLCHIEVPVRLRSLIKAVRCRSPLRASHDHSASVGVLCIVSHSTKSISFWVTHQRVVCRHADLDAVVN